MYDRGKVQSTCPMRALPLPAHVLKGGGEGVSAVGCGSVRFTIKGRNLHPHPQDSLLLLLF
jgi:hypothetical protein